MHNNNLLKNGILLVHTYVHLYTVDFIFNAGRRRRPSAGVVFYFCQESLHLEGEYSFTFARHLIPRKQTHPNIYRKRRRSIGKVELSRKHFNFLYFHNFLVGLTSYTPRRVIKNFLNSRAGSRNFLYLIRFCIFHKEQSWLRSKLLAQIIETWHFWYDYLKNLTLGEKKLL